MIKHSVKYLVISVSTVVAMGSARADDAGDAIGKRILWSDAPLSLLDESGNPRRRAKWSQFVYPIGNGRLGATIFGGPAEERIQFNEDSVWVGNEDNTGGYQPFGDIYLELPHQEFSNYRRELDISRALHTITYKSGGVSYKREYFSSYPDQVMVMRFTADKPGALSGRAFLGNVHELPMTVEGKDLVLKGDTDGFWWWQQQMVNEDKRLAFREYASDKNIDHDLEELLYQYARYLILGSSRPGHGGLPANLQGLWLIDRRPAWLGDYHTDINVQMCHWLTGPSNLPECFVPLAEWIDSIREVRKEETKRVFNIDRGWLMRSENNVFGGSTWHVQKGDSAWLCQSLWDHYAFTRDKDYLKKYAYPVMKEISEFWVDHLKELPDGTLVAPDGRSPEHGPEKADGVTYDQQLCWDLFTNVIEASEALGVDEAYRKQLTAKRGKLLGPKIGKWGQLQEWMEDIDDPNDKHRHINHLIGVYPGRQISPAGTPEFAEAAKVGLIARGHGPTGWSKAWKISLFARGDYEIDMDWKDGRLTKAVVRAGENSAGKCVVRHGGKTTLLELAPGEQKTLTAESFRSP